MRPIASDPVHRVPRPALAGCRERAGAAGGDAVPGMTSRKLLIAVFAAALVRGDCSSRPRRAELHRVHGDARDGPDAHADGRRPARHAGPAGADPRPAGAGRGDRRPRPGRGADAGAHRPARRPARGRPARGRRADARPHARQPAGRRQRLRSGGGNSGSGNSGGGDGSTKLAGQQPGRGERGQPRRRQRPLGRRARTRQGRGRGRRPERRRLAHARPTRPSRCRRPGPAPIGVPNFFIDKFRIPPFLLPIYQAAGIAVRHPLGGPRRDQRDRDRLRPQPQRLLRRRARLDAVHARDLGAVRRRRQPRRPQGPVQPGRRDLRRRALPAAPPAPTQDIRARDLRLQPRRLVRRLRAACARA